MLLLPLFLVCMSVSLHPATCAESVVSMRFTLRFDQVDISTVTQGLLDNALRRVLLRSSLPLASGYEITKTCKYLISLRLRGACTVVPAARPQGKQHRHYQTLQNYDAVVVDGAFHRIPLGAVTVLSAVLKEEAALARSGGGAFSALATSIFVESYVESIGSGNFPNLTEGTDYHDWRPWLSVSIGLIISSLVLYYYYTIARKSNKIRQRDENGDEINNRRDTMSGGSSDSDDEALEPSPALAFSRRLSGTFLGQAGPCPTVNPLKNLGGMRGSSFAED